MTECAIYLDNAATTWPKPEAVYRAVDMAMREHGANPGRGSYRMSVDAQRIVEGTRLDAAQSAGNLEIDMQDLWGGCPCCSRTQGPLQGHGTGVLVLTSALPVMPWREGGTGFKSENPEQPEEYPWRLEAGTLNLPGIAGLAAGVRFVRSVVVNAIAEHESNLARVLADGLRQIDGVSVYCDPAPRSGVVSFRLDGGDVALTGTILDEEFGIAARTGLHCAPATHKAIGTFPEGTVRVSFGQFNTPAHVDALLTAVRELEHASTGGGMR